MSWLDRLRNALGRGSRLNATPGEAEEVLRLARSLGELEAAAYIQDVADRLPGPESEPAERRGMAYQLKLTVVDAPRPVWRRVRVFGDVSMYTLNQYIRRAFGWEIERDYRLRVRRPWTAEPKANRERRVSLYELVSQDDALSFIYRDGHGWEVHAWVEATGPRLRSLRPTCIGGGGSNLPAEPDRPWLPPHIREDARRRRAAIRSEAGEPIEVNAVTACMQQRPAAGAAAELVVDDQRCTVCQRPTPKLRHTACCGRLVCYDKSCGRHDLHGRDLPGDTPR